MNGNTCCVTGHREISKGKWAYVQAELRNSVKKAVSQGCTHFISGFAAGVDLAFAAIVAEFISQGYALTLEAAIPYA